MAVVAGIDEAGYGPLLGPLVVSATAFRLPEDALGENLWKRFGGAVCQDAPKDSGKLRVADSKLIYRGGNGVRDLECNLLPFLGVLGPLPETLRAHVAAMRTDGLASIDRYPWYRNQDLPLPRHITMQEMADCATLLHERLSATLCTFIFARAEVVHAAEFNKEVRACRSKAILLARRNARLIESLWQEFGEEHVMLYVDKHGGRNTYSTFLRVVFPDCHLSVFEESALLSRYCVSQGNRRMEFRFEPRADSTHLPVALASMLSKYTRELFMELLNDYWLHRLPGLRPTAGYYGDGRRFLNDIETARKADGIAKDLLERCK